MKEPTPEEIAAFASAQAAVQGLPLPEAYRPGVEANLAVAFRMAGLFLDEPLPDDAEPAPVFDPHEGR
jgi:hypothetical protein